MVNWPISRISPSERRSGRYIPIKSKSIAVDDCRETHYTSPRDLFRHPDFLNEVFVQIPKNAKKFGFEIDNGRSPGEESESILIEAGHVKIIYYQEAIK